MNSKSDVTENEESNTAEDKQEHIKQRLKDLGVSDDSTRPKKSWFSSYGTYLMVAIIASLVFVFWLEYSSEEKVVTKRIMDKRTVHNQNSNSGPYAPTNNMMASSQPQQNKNHQQMMQQHTEKQKQWQQQRQQAWEQQQAERKEWIKQQQAQQARRDDWVKQQQAQQAKAWEVWQQRLNEQQARYNQRGNNPQANGYQAPPNGFQVPPNYQYPAANAPQYNQAPGWQPQYQQQQPYPNYPYANRW